MRLRQNFVNCPRAGKFSELLVQVNKMSEKDALFSFLDRLKPWAKLELQGPRAHKSEDNDRRLYRVQV